jgi:hypothetical protein
VGQVFVVGHGLKISLGNGWVKLFLYMEQCSCI